MSLTDELQRLRELHQSGALSDEEFTQAKAALIGNPRSEPTPKSPPGPGRRARYYGLMLWESDVMIGFFPDPPRYLRIPDRASDFPHVRIPLDQVGQARTAIMILYDGWVHETKRPI